MKHSVGLPEKANTLIYAGRPNKYRKLTNTKLQNAKHKISSNTRTGRQRDRHAHTKLLKWQI